MQTTSRYGFLDLYRGIIVVLMLQGHFVREVLGLPWRSEPWFGVHELFHGLTAPGFLFGAGFTFAIATQRKREILRGFNPQVLRRIGRGVLLVATAYALHFPYLSLSKTLSEATLQQWQEFLRFDVLQLIGFGLISLRLLYVFFRDDDHFLLAVAGLAFIMAAVTPEIWKTAVASDIPLWLRQSLTGGMGSPFPLFPYAGFMYAGVAVSWGFIRSAKAEQERRYMLRMLAGGIVMIPGGLLLDEAAGAVYQNVDFWLTSPGYFLTRLGLLLVSLCGLWVLESAVADTPASRLWMPRWLTTLGVESLFVYIAHLLLLYGWVVNPDINLASMFGPTFSPAVAFSASALFVVLLAILASLWRTLKKDHAPLLRLMYWWVGLSVAGEFLFRPY